MSTNGLVSAVRLRMSCLFRFHLLLSHVLKMGELDFDTVVSILRDNFALTFIENCATR